MRVPPRDRWRRRPRTASWGRTGFPPGSPRTSGPRDRRSEPPRPTRTPGREGSASPGRGEEVKEEQPDQEWDVPEELHIARGQSPQRPKRRGPERARENPEPAGEDPTQGRETDRRPEPLKEPAPVVSGPEDTPLKSVRHCGSWTTSESPASSGMT